jgi:hypothetical protein
MTPGTPAEPQGPRPPDQVPRLDRRELPAAAGARDRQRGTVVPEQGEHVLVQLAVRPDIGLSEILLGWVVLGCHHGPHVVRRRGHGRTTAMLSRINRGDGA